MKSIRTRNITHNILIAVAIILAILTGISVMAWLLPNAFYSLGTALVNMTGNKDIQLNVVRIGGNPIPYAITFGLIALCVRWFASKF